MIEISFGPADLARIRFARSPIQELVGSLHVLVDPVRQAMHGPWLTTAEPKIASLGLELLPALIAPKTHAANFLMPPPERPEVEFGEEVERVRATTPEQVRADLDQFATGRGSLGQQARKLYENPDRYLGRLVDEVVAYWRAAIAPVWPRLRALADADLAYRAGQLTNDGVAGLFAGLNPRVEYSGEGLRVRTANWAVRESLYGTGLMLVPCAFVWPKVVVQACSPEQQPMLTYAPRGIATVWAGRTGAVLEPLGQLLGRSRAALLAYLDLPVSTTQLAAQFGLTPPTVSEHLAVLRRTGLITSRRAGRSILHQRTPLAAQLLDAPSDH